MGSVFIVLWRPEATISRPTNGIQDRIFTRSEICFYCAVAGGLQHILPGLPPHNLILFPPVVRQLFRPRTGSAGLLEDKKRCKTIIDERYVMCVSGAGEGVEHLSVTCE